MNLIFTFIFILILFVNCYYFSIIGNVLLMGNIAAHHLIFLRSKSKQNVETISPTGMQNSQ